MTTRTQSLASRRTPLAGALASLRERRQPLSPAELVRHLLAIDAAVEPRLARRIAAAALGVSVERLPDAREAFEFWRGDEAACAAVALAEASFVVVDLETTGLSPDRARILEIGAVRIARLRCADRFTSLVRPGGPVPASIAALTGIDDAMVAEAPLLEQVMPRFDAWLGRAPSAPFVAHNASFDARFVERALQEHELGALARPILCTRRLARRLVPSLERFDLDSVTAHFGIANRDRHRAQGDADAAAKALLELLELARAREGIETLGELFDLQERRPRRRGR